MGLKCSLLGHAFEPAGVERDREEQGSEVVTVVRELETCSRCGEERVVSESTEVTTVVEPDDGDEPVGGGADERTGGQEGGLGSAVDRGVEGAEPDGSVGGPAVEETSGHAAERGSGHADDEFEARDPEEEDTEILTDDDEPEREPGEWPDDGEPEPDEEPPVDFEAEAPGEESLSGITVPEGRIVCPECGFEVDAESSYRDGDPCPECGAWLTTESD
jgi:ribosomal protein S27AE